MKTQPEVKLITLEAMPGARVIAVHGLALGNSTARTHVPAQKTLRALKTNSGLGPWEARDEALECLRTVAAASGANAVLGVRLDSVSTCEGMAVDIVAYGTAVTVEPLAG